MSGAPVLIMAGGTGGHIFPALAVADALRNRNQPVVWLGSPVGMEAKVIPQKGIDIEWLPVKGLRRKGVVAWLLAPWRLTKSVYSAIRILHRRQPGVVLGMGGFVTGPGGVSAWILHKPLVIHEQNAVAGLTNRILARFARRVFEAFPGSFGPKVTAEAVGNPVRPEIAAIPEPLERLGDRQGPVRLLILGGSQGAQALNDIIPKALALLPDSARPEVWHQAGEAILDVAQRAYEQAQVSARVMPFIEDMAAAYSWADLVVCRAGALTIAELTAAGVGAVLVPYPSAVDDHQTKNAAVMVAAGAGQILPQEDLTPDKAASVLEQLILDRSVLLQMAVAARRIGIADAGQVIAEACLKFLPKESARHD